MKLRIPILIASLAVSASFASFEAAFTAKIKNDKMKQTLQALQNQIAAFKKSYKKEDVADIEIAQQIMAKLSRDAAMIVEQANAKFGTPVTAAIATTMPSPSASASASTAAMPASQPIQLPPSYEEATAGEANVKSGVPLSTLPQVPSRSASATMPSPSASSSASASAMPIPAASSSVAQEIEKIRTLFSAPIRQYTGNHQELLSNGEMGYPDTYTILPGTSERIYNPQRLEALVRAFLQLPNLAASDKKALGAMIIEVVREKRSQQQRPWAQWHGFRRGDRATTLVDLLEENGILPENEHQVLTF